MSRLPATLLCLVALAVSGQQAVASSPTMLFMDNFTGMGVINGANMNQPKSITPFTTYSSESNGNIELYSGGLLMESTSFKDDVLNEIDLDFSALGIDLSGYTDITLTFNHKAYTYSDYDEEAHGFGTDQSYSPYETGELNPFTGHSNADGVAISDDGNYWVPIWTPESNDWQKGWYSVTVNNLEDLANDNGLLLESLKIRFQQYDKYFKPKSGRGWDWITIVGTPSGGPTGDSTPVVPEPSSLALLGIGGALLGAARRRRRKPQDDDESPEAE